jgi:hypothetical protein
MSYVFDRTQNGGLSEKELAENLLCRQEHRAHWVVTVREANYSAFNGRHRTPSDYSEIVCEKLTGGCGRRWRTRGAYVRSLPDAR